MADFRLPGPICRFLGAWEIDAGTMCQWTSRPSGPIGAKTQPGVPRKIVPVNKAIMKVKAAPQPDERLEKLKHDVSTNIVELVRAFAADMTSEAGKLREARIKKREEAQKAAGLSAGAKPESPKIPVVTFYLDPNKATEVRTPAEQAWQVAQSKSWVCWSAHMADKARHVIMKADGAVKWDAAVVFGEDFGTFKARWGEGMKKHGLKNFQARDGWADGDSFHLELPESKMSQTDERVQACLDEYVRLTREGDQKQNDKFEAAYEKILTPFVEKYSKQVVEDKLP